jgi:hypothetical protein
MLARVDTLPPEPLLQPSSLFLIRPLTITKVLTTETLRKCKFLFIVFYSIFVGNFPMDSDPMDTD